VALSESEMREFYELKAARKRGPISEDKLRRYYELERRQKNS
jgi:hypothetical protein